MRKFLNSFKDTLYSAGSYWIKPDDGFFTAWAKNTLFCVGMGFMMVLYAIACTVLGIMYGVMKIFDDMDRTCLNDDYASYKERA